MPARAPETLPIDERLDEIVGALRARGAVVVVADPGAGKTTRVPRALVERGLAGDGEVVVLEPRRLAARLAAQRVAEEIGERVGGTVGYQVRFDEAASARTRVRFVTEGILTRRLASDPSLRGVAAVVLDEFHERHLHGDVALAALRALQRGARPDLRIAVMSATLDAEPVARFLDGEVVRVAGRRFEVAIEHAARPDERPLEKQVSAALRQLLRDGLDGDVLVFLPGAAEIRRAAEACAEPAAAGGLDVVMLHGDLPPDEQERAVRRGPRRKVILSTNVAESSVTIEGVAAVIDSGLARVARHSPWSGLPSLTTAPVSQASAAQRAGRAGRTRAGRCLRLYTRADLDGRPSHDAPEIRRADLAETALALRALGVADVAGWGWFEAPPAAALAAADKLLARLGAVADGAPTALGRRMLALPLHPRLARLALAAAERGAGERGCLLAALVGEREIRRGVRSFGGGRHDASGDSDLLDRIEAFEAVAREGLRPDRIRAHDLDPGAVFAVDRARKQLWSILRRERERERERERSDDEPLLIATLCAFPDRVAKRRAARSPEVVFAGGGAARLAESSVVRDAELLVAVDADERKGALPTVRLASAVTPEWLLDLFPERLAERTETRFDPATERVETVSALAWDGLVLDESRRPPQDGGAPDAWRALADAALAAGPARFADADELARLHARSAFLRTVAPDFPLLDDAAARAALAALCEGRVSFAELRAASLLDAVRARLAPPELALLERAAPERIALPGGRRARVEYPPGQAPYVASRMQDFFGMRDGPRVADGKVALVLHLLAPNNRPVQVTTDLAGFWQRHWPSLRRELMRRYPKHAWPEDGATATPPPAKK